MGLLGAYSNPEIQGRLRQMSEKLDRLAASKAAPCPSGRQDRRLRGGLVPKAIERVLRETLGPMRARDIHAEVEQLLDRSVPVSSVKNWLAKHTQGDHPTILTKVEPAQSLSGLGLRRAHDPARIGPWGRHPGQLSSVDVVLPSLSRRIPLTDLMSADGRKQPTARYSTD
jgi:hypothetical protein